MFFSVVSRIFGRLFCSQVRLHFDGSRYPFGTLWVPFWSLWGSFWRLKAPLAPILDALGAHRDRDEKKVPKIELFSLPKGSKRVTISLYFWQN